MPPAQRDPPAHPNQDTCFLSLMLRLRCLTHLCPFIARVFHGGRGLAALLIPVAQHLARSGCCEMDLCFAALRQVEREGGWGQGCGRLGTPGVEGAACSQKLDLREAEAGRCRPPCPHPSPPRHASHSFPSWSPSHLLSLKAAEGANMYVMNISSPARGFAGEL